MFNNPLNLHKLCNSKQNVTQNNEEDNITVKNIPQQLQKCISTVEDNSIPVNMKGHCNTKINKQKQTK